ncbi:MAG: hypothetical protein GY729_07640 [Desulfobacteraceae bacterium]|nr:hypothetical protein [Desulfobacteraceae bacterium]
MVEITIQHIAQIAANQFVNHGYVDPFVVDLLFDQCGINIDRYKNKELGRSIMEKVVMLCILNSKDAKAVKDFIKNRLEYYHRGDHIPDEPA